MTLYLFFHVVSEYDWSTWFRTMTGIYQQIQFSLKSLLQCQAIYNLLLLLKRVLFFLEQLQASFL